MALQIRGDQDRKEHQSRQAPAQHIGQAVSDNGSADHEGARAKVHHADAHAKQQGIADDGRLDRLTQYRKNCTGVKHTAAGENSE